MGQYLSSCTRPGIQVLLRVIRLPLKKLTISGMVKMNNLDGIETVCLQMVVNHGLGRNGGWEIKKQMRRSLSNLSLTSRLLVTKDLKIGKMTAKEDLLLLSFVISFREIAGEEQARPSLSIQLHWVSPKASSKMKMMIGGKNIQSKKNYSF